MRLLQLPDDIILSIVAHLQIEAIIQLRQVNILQVIQVK